MLLLKKKNVFFGNVFSKNVFFKISKTFPPIKNLSKIVFNFFEKTFPKKRIFFKKRKMIFFQKNKVLVYRSKKHFFSEKKVFLSKIKCPLNCPFSKMSTFTFALK